MTISFNNIPKSIRTPGAYGEIDPSRALQGLIALPHKVLILGQKITDGTVPVETLVALSKDGLADGFFGPGSIGARMANFYKKNNIIDNQIIKKESIWIKIKKFIISLFKK